MTFSNERFKITALEDIKDIVDQGIYIARRTCDLYDYKFTDDSIDIEVIASNILYILQRDYNIDLEDVKKKICP